jgi:hypothetical protein
MLIFAVLFTSSRARRLGAKEVINIELVTQVVAKAVHIIYAPILRVVSPGAEPYKPGRFRIIGKIVPALLAVFDGVKGARIRSDKVIA